MENLYQSYQRLFKTKGKWRYYRNLQIKEFPLDNEDLAWKFIQEYYKAGEKSKVFDDNIKKEEIRSLHSASVFFLGILISNLVIGENSKKDLKPSFKYLWFITSLYHDYSYLIEYNKSAYPPTKYYNINSIYKKFDIKYKLFEDYKPKKFSTKIIESYLRYGIKEFDFLNHGIVGGILLYDRLRKNYDKAYEEYKEQNPLACKECFEHKDLLWSTSQFDFFSEMSYSIINHNIWFCPKGKESVYLSYGLGDLIIKDKADEYKKHSKAENSFLFLLVFADTIEPFKRSEFSYLTTKEILEKIDIKIVKNRIKINVLEDTLPYKEWFGDIKDLETWMKVKVEEKETNIAITIL